MLLNQIFILLYGAQKVRDAVSVYSAEEIEKLRVQYEATYAELRAAEREINEKIRSLSFYQKITGAAALATARPILEKYRLRMDNIKEINFPDLPSEFNLIVNIELPQQKHKLPFGQIAVEEPSITGISVDGNEASDISYDEVEKPLEFKLIINPNWAKNLVDAVKEICEVKKQNLTIEAFDIEAKEYIKTLKVRAIRSLSDSDENFEKALRINKKYEREAQIIFKRCQTWETLSEAEQRTLKSYSIALFCLNRVTIQSFEKW